MYTNWMKTIQEKARTTLEQTGEAMKKYYDQRATAQSDIDIGDLVMLNAKNIMNKLLRVADSKKTNRTRLMSFFIVDGDCLRRLVGIILVWCEVGKL